MSKDILEKVKLSTCSVCGGTFFLGQHPENVSLLIMIEPSDKDHSGCAKLSALETIHRAREEAQRYFELMIVTDDKQKKQK